MRIGEVVVGVLFPGGLLAQVPCTQAFLPGLSLPGMEDFQTVSRAIWWDPDGAGPLPERLVVAGRFLAIAGVPARAIASFDPASGTWAQLGPGLGATPQIAAQVSDLLVLANGQLLVCGAFALPGSSMPTTVARWDGSQWTALGNDLDGSVGTLAQLPNGDILAAGQLWVGAQRSPIARWNGTAWSIPGGGLTPDYVVAGMRQLPNGDVLLTGQFTAPGPGRVVWNGTSWLPAPTLGDGFVNQVITAPNGDFVVLGTFTNVGGIAANGIVRWDGQNWSAFGPGFTFGGPGEFVVTTGFFANGDLVVGGRFAAIGGVPAANVARWNGTVWAPLGAGVSNPLSFPAAPGGVSSVATLPDGSLLVFGGFSRAGDVITRNIAQWDAVEWSAVSSGSNGALLSLTTLRNGSVIAGGYFTVLGSGPARAIARWDGSDWWPLGAGMRGATSGSVATVAAVLERANGELIAVGDFATADGVSVANVARWDGAAWHALGSGLTGGTGFGPRAVCAAELPNGDLVVGGWFATAGSVTANGLARWNGSTWSAIGSGVGGVPYPKVSALAVLGNGDLIAAGSFRSIGGAAANHIARWDGSSWAPLGSGFGPDPWVEVMDLSQRANGELIAAGSFAVAGGVAAASVARWSGSAWSGFPSAPPGFARRIGTTPDGDLLLAGEMVRGNERHALARHDGASWTVVESRIGNNLEVPIEPWTYALAVQPDGVVHIGGSFAYVGNYLPAAYAARLVSTCAAAASEVGNGCVGTGGSERLVATALPWLGASSTATATGLPAPAIGVSVFGNAAISVPLVQLLPQGGAGCSLLVQPDLVDLVLPIGGSAVLRFSVPSAPSLIGAVVWQQVLAAELDAAGSIVALTSTNALSSTLGVF